MCKLIKKQIVRSMPVFVIIVLITSTVSFGLFFNLDLGVHKKGDNNNLKVSLGAPEVQAQDWATTTVRVLNAPPSITVAPAENPVSTSTSPVNVGGSIGFTVTATDLELNNYYLLICSSPSATPANGGAPECDGVRFCRSESTVSGDPTSCTYNNVADPGSEVQEWYAFVCDDHGTEAECSSPTDPLIQGAAAGIGDSSSPFYVNHAPVFSNIETTDDNKDPGGTFTVTATVSDIDVAGGPDEVYLYVCSSPDWSPITGCGVSEWCSGTTTDATAGGVLVNCSFATTTPALKGVWEYYAFVKDWHNMPAAANHRTGEYTVNNVAPVVTDVIINDANDVYLTMKTMDEVEVFIRSVNVTDNNSCMDIESATGTVYISTALNANHCADDPNTCYQIESINCVYESGSCTGPTDIDASYTCTTTMKFHTTSSEAGGSNPLGTAEWLGAITAIDYSGAKGTGVTAPLSGVDVMQLLALEVYVNTPGEPDSQIAYGSVRGGTDTGDYNATTTVENYGNVPMYTSLAVSDMIKDVDDDYIDAINQQFATSTFSYGVGSYYAIASTSPSQIVPTATLKPINEAVAVSDEIYWGIGIPAGTISGNYYGANTFIANLNTTGW